MAKSRYVLVLSGSIGEGNTYAKRVGLERFSYRAIGARKQVQNIQVADVHILPSFHKRPDKHAILGELRWGRDIVYKDVEMPPAPPREGDDRYGEQLTIDEILSEQAEFAKAREVQPLPEIQERLNQAIIAKVDEDRLPDLFKKNQPHKVTNNTGKPERVLTPEQHEHLKGLFS